MSCLIRSQGLLLAFVWWCPGATWLAGRVWSVRFVLTNGEAEDTADFFRESRFFCIGRLLWFLHAPLSLSRPVGHDMAATSSKTRTGTNTKTYARSRSSTAPRMPSERYVTTLTLTPAPHMHRGLSNRRGRSECDRHTQSFPTHSWVGCCHHNDNRSDLSTTHLHLICSWTGFEWILCRRAFVAPDICDARSVHLFSCARLGCRCLVADGQALCCYVPSTEASMMCVPDAYQLCFQWS